MLWAGGARHCAVGPDEGVSSQVPYYISFYGCYLEGQGDFVSRLMALKTHIVILVILIINLLTKSP